MVLNSGYQFTWLVNKVGMLLVVCQLSHDVIGYEDS